MLTRREFIAGAAKVLAGGVAVASGVLAIVPRAAEEVHWLSARPFMDNVMQPFADGMMDGIASQVGPRWDMYEILVQGPHEPSDNYKRIVRTYDRGEMIAAGVDWDPRPGEICELGIVMSKTLSWRSRKGLDVRSPSIRLE